MSAHFVNNMQVTRQIGPFIVDYFPDDDTGEIVLHIWRSDRRDTGYSVTCSDPDQVKAVVAQVEGAAR